MSNEYSIYQTAMSTMVSLYRKHLGQRIPKKERKGKEFVELVVRHSMENDEFAQSFNSAILLDEFEWEREGYRMYFPAEASFLGSRKVEFVRGKKHTDGKILHVCHCTGKGESAQFCRSSLPVEYIEDCL